MSSLTTRLQWLQEIERVAVLSMIEYGGTTVRCEHVLLAIITLIRSGNPVVAVAQSMLNHFNIGLQELEDKVKEKLTRSDGVYRSENPLGGDYQHLVNWATDSAEECDQALNSGHLLIAVGRTHDSQASPALSRCGFDWRDATQFLIKQPDLTDGPPE